MATYVLDYIQAEEGSCSSGGRELQRVGADGDRLSAFIRSGPLWSALASTLDIRYNRKARQVNKVNQNHLLLVHSLEDINSQAVRL
jgi:hypothetical protein